MFTEKSGILNSFQRTRCVNGINEKTVNSHGVDFERKTFGFGTSWPLAPSFFIFILESLKITIILFKANQIHVIDCKIKVKSNNLHGK